MGLIRRTPSALRDYGAIWDHVAAAAHPDVADALLRLLDEKLRLISDVPGMGKARPELRPRLRSFPVGKYLLFYRPVRGGIELVRVIHGARDLRQIFKRRRKK
jgi:toxin ParE1/3/4